MTENSTIWVACTNVMDRRQTDGWCHKARNVR